MVKHFFKTLMIFTGMILLGLLGLLLINYFDNGGKTANSVESQKGVAK